MLPFRLSEPSVATTTPLRVYAALVGPSSASREEGHVRSRGTTPSAVRRNLPDGVGPSFQLSHPFCQVFQAASYSSSLCSVYDGTICLISHHPESCCAGPEDPVFPALDRFQHS
jgi:hypothetical protein